MRRKELLAKKGYHVFSAIISAVVLMTAMPVNAIAETPEDAEAIIVQNEDSINQYASEEDKTGKVSSESDFVIEDGILRSYTGTDEDVVIPSGVKVIWDGAFAGQTDIKSVVIPEGVTEIGAGAFAFCKNLSNITIPNSVISIGDEAFSGTQWLEIKRAENPMVLVNSILLDGTTMAGDVIIPSGVTVIGPHAFYSYEEDSKITSVTIPDSVTEICSGAFSGCNNIETLKIPNSVVKIGESAFSNCSSLTTINLPDTLQNLSYGMFNSCSGLTEIEIPDSVESIGGIAFENCSSLMKIKFPVNLKEIGYAAFRGCSNLQELELPEGLQELDNAAFANCSNLSKITIPSSVYYIDTFDYEPAFENSPVTIYGEENSYAQSYAEEHNIPFSITGDNPSEVTLLVKNLKGTVSEDQITLTWDETIGADGYIIYESVDEGKSHSEIAHIEDGSITSYVHSGLQQGNIYVYRMQAYRIIDGEIVLGSYSDDFRVNEDIQQEQKIHMTVAAQERDLKNGSRTTMSKACTLKLGFDVDDPDLKLTYQTSDPAVATVKDGKITYQGVGTCTIIVTAEETDTCKETSLGIKVKVGKPGAPTFTPSITKKTAKKAFTATSSTVKGVDGWEVQYSIRKDFWKPVTKDFPNTGTKLYRKTCTTMQSKRTYYIHVRGYQIVDGKKIYSDWSPVKTVKTK